MSNHQHIIGRFSPAEESVSNKYYQNPRLVRLEEKSLSRILSYHQDKGYIIVSAYRSAKAEGTEPEQQKAQNYKNDAELRQILKQKGLSFFPVYGGFKEKTPEGSVDVTEPSYLVTFRDPNQGDIEALRDIGVELARRFNQDSIFFKEPGAEGKGYFVNKDGKIEMTFSSLKVNDAAQDFFTKLFQDVWGSKRDLPLNQRKTDKRFTHMESLELFRMESPADVQEARSRYGEHPFFNNEFFNQ